jgi:hypothetical protein
VECASLFHPTPERLAVTDPYQGSSVFMTQLDDGAGWAKDGNGMRYSLTQSFTFNRSL